MRTRRAAFLLFVVSTSFGLAIGSDVDLTATLFAVSPGVRSSSPFAVVVTLRSRHSEILSGNLDFSIHHDSALVGRYLGPEIAVAPGEQSYRLLLPPMSEGGLSSQASVQLNFAVDGQPEVPIDLGFHVVPAAGMEDRSFVILASGWPIPSVPILNSLKFESLDPALAGSRLFSSHVVTQEARALPVRALEYCTVDLVFLSGRGFTTLREDQLHALASWVEAGGSLLVAVRGGVGPRQLRFLNRLAPQTRGAPTFQRDSQSLLSLADGQTGSRAVRLTPGLGRAAVVVQPPGDADLESRSWRGLVAFLWKCRPRVVSDIERRGSPREDLELIAPGPLPIDADGRLLRVFVPDGFRLPFGPVFWVVVVFFLAIGPIEYFLLSRPRRQRLTWFLIPALAVGFSVLMVILAEYSMSGVESEKSITFHDVGPGGRILRSNRYEIVLQNTETRLAREVTEGLVSVLTRREFDPDFRLAFLEQGNETVPRYEGRVPGRYRVTQRISKWSPRLLRTLTIGGEAAEDQPKLDWDAVGPAVFRATSNAAGLRKLLVDGDFVGSVHLLHRHRRVTVSGKIPSEWRPILLPACARRSEGLFTLVSQISPTGGGNFEDLAVVDRTNADEWLLVAAVPRGDDLVVFRRLYREGKP